MVRTWHLPGKVVEEIMEEDHGDDTFTKSQLVRMHKLRSGQCNPYCECAAHPARSDQEQRTTAKTIDHASPEPSFNHIYHQDEAVELVLIIRAVDAKIFQDVVQVVCRQAGAGELGEDTAAKTDKDPIAVAT